VFDIYLHLLDAEKNDANIILQSAFCYCASWYCTKQQMKISAMCHGSPIYRPILSGN